MHIESLRISNFRAIRDLRLTNLSDLVVVAGINGCGKSSIFNAIRLLKSAYGDYHSNELQTWFSEFQLDLNRVSHDSRGVLGSNERPLEIAADFRFAPEELQFLRRAGRHLIEQANWKRITGRSGTDPMTGLPAVVLPQDRVRYANQVKTQTDTMTAQLIARLDAKDFSTKLTLKPTGPIQIEPSPVMELVLSSFLPDSLGIIDYHGSQRVFGRKKLTTINLQLSNQQTTAQTALYNIQNKYANIKTQMAGEYVRQMFAEQAGALPPSSDLISTLSEMFKEFFPGKTFLGPTPRSDGALDFPVQLSDGTTHDIDDLSSGEKEVLLGYLRLRNATPRNSVILIDEPELHLNPKMIKGLASFYRRNIGQAMANQLWLITHSDTLIRDAIEEPGSDCFHMLSAHAIRKDQDQLTKIDAQADVESVVMDLVGDLATYGPRSKVVILEGGGDTEFDLKMIAALFPEFANEVNLVSGESKSRVRQLHDLLEKVASDSNLDVTFYSIVDRDFDEKPAEGLTQYTWDVYHIENFLLDSAIIAETVNGLDIVKKRKQEEIEAMLFDCAKELLDKVIDRQLTRHVGREMGESLVSKAIPGNDPIHLRFAEAAKISSERIARKLKGSLSESELEATAKELREKFERALKEDRWKEVFPGRSILRLLSEKLGIGVKYEILRNAVMNTLKRNEVRPSGMEKVLNEITQHKSEPSTSTDVLDT